MHQVFESVYLGGTDHNCGEGERLIVGWMKGQQMCLSFRVTRKISRLLEVSNLLFAFLFGTVGRSENQSELLNPIF